MKKKLVLTYPPKAVNKPAVYHLVKDFDLEVNILRAKIEQGQTGVLVLELKGPKENFEKGLKYLESLGIEVQHLAKDIVLDEAQCIICGNCTGVCPTDALTLNENSDLVFNKEKCILCENCVVACPTRAIKLLV